MLSKESTSMFVDSFSFQLRNKSPRITDKMLFNKETKVIMFIFNSSFFPQLNHWLITNTLRPLNDELSNTVHFHFIIIVQHVTFSWVYVHVQTRPLVVPLLYHNGRKLHTVTYRLSNMRNVQIEIEYSKTTYMYCIKYYSQKK